MPLIVVFGHIRVEVTSMVIMLVMIVDVSVSDIRDNVQILSNLNGMCFQMVVDFSSATKTD